jgi:hypothetical protein
MEQAIRDVGASYADLQKAEEFVLAKLRDNKLLTEGEGIVHAAIVSGVWAQAKQRAMGILPSGPLPTPPTRATRAAASEADLVALVQAEADDAVFNLKQVMPAGVPFFVRVILDYGDNNHVRTLEGRAGSGGSVKKDVEVVVQAKPQAKPSPAPLPNRKGDAPW